MAQVKTRPDTEPKPTALHFTDEERELIKTMVKGADEADLKLFLYQCERTGLNPLLRQAHPFKRYDQDLKRQVMNIQTSIDGLRLIAERTGQYAGQLGPFWCGEDGQWYDAWVSDEPPRAAKVAALRADFSEPCWGIARYKSYVQRKRDNSPNRFWALMDDLMLAKCAEALALRRAFPQDLSGVYASEEVGQEENLKTDEQKADEWGERAAAKSVITREPWEDRADEIRDLLGKCASTEDIRAIWGDKETQGHIKAMPDHVQANLIAEKDAAKDRIDAPMDQTPLDAG